MKLRIIYGTLIVSVFVAMPVVGPLAQIIGGGICIMLSVYELASAFKKHEHSKPSLILCYLYIIASLVSYYYVGFFGLFFNIGLFSMALLSRPIIYENINQNDVASSIFLLIYPCTLGLFFPLTGYLPGNYAPIAMLAIGMYASIIDIMAFCVGSLIGKHKLIVRISPNKTVEGAIGGFSGGIIAGLFFFYLIQPSFQINISLMDYIIMGIFCGVFAQLGDLTASALKRFTEIKDFSNLLPGHGGILDRLDSLLFCGPIIFSYIYLIAKLG